MSNPILGRNLKIKEIPILPRRIRIKKYLKASPIPLGRMQKMASQGLRRIPKIKRKKGIRKILRKSCMKLKGIGLWVERPGNTTIKDGQNFRFWDTIWSCKIVSVNLHVMMKLEYLFKGDIYVKLQ